MKLPAEKFVQHEKCSICGHEVRSHRLTNTSAGVVVMCKAIDAAGDECGCDGPEPSKIHPVVWSR